MASSIGGPVDLLPQRPCPSCHVNTLRRGEKHIECFDCVGHGPLNHEDLRCLICQAWRPEHFLAATAKYAEGSAARADALSLAAARDPAPEVPDVSEDPEVPGQDLGGGEQSITPAAGTVTVSVPPPPPGLGVPSPNDLRANILAVLESLGIFPPPVGEAGGEKRVAPTSSPKASKGKKGKKKRRIASSSVSVPPMTTASDGQGGGDRGPDGVATIQGVSGLSHDDRGSDDGRDTHGPLILSDSSKLWTGNHDRQGLACKPHDRAGDRPHDRVAFPGPSRGREDPHGLLGAAMRPAVLSTLPARGGVPVRTVGAASAVSGLRSGPRSSDPETSSLSTTTRGEMDMEVDAGLPTVESDSDREEAPVERSNFRWVVEQIAHLMGLPAKIAPQTVGTGRFASTPTEELIALPLANTVVKKCQAINDRIVSKKEVGRSEPAFPLWRHQARAAAVYASAPTEGLCSAAPLADEHIGLLGKRKGAIWSAQVKKQRLSTWQAMVHQVLGQLSMGDHTAVLAQDILDDSALPDELAARIQATLGVLVSTLHSAQRVTATLAAHLDLTAREAELRTLDVSEVDQAELRSRPLFEGHVFGGLSRADILQMRTVRKEDAVLQHFASSTKPPTRPPTQKKQEKSSASSFTGPQSSFRSSAPPRRESKGRKGRGRGAKTKSS